MSVEKLITEEYEQKKVYMLFTSVQVLYFFLNAIELYELCTIKPKGWFYTPVVFLPGTYKVCFAFGKKDQENTLYLSKKTTVINVFYFESELDFQICFLTFSIFKLTKTIEVWNSFGK